MAGTGPAGGFCRFFGVDFHNLFLVDLHTEAGALRETGVAFFVDGPADLGNVFGVVALASLVDEEEGYGGHHMHAGGHAEHSGGVVGRKRHVVGLTEGGDFLHLADAAASADVGLEHVDAALVQVWDEFPDGAVAFAGGQGHVDRLLEALENLDVAGHGGFLDEKHVLRLKRIGQLDEESRGHGAVGIEHDSAVGAEAFP